ncbi:Rnf-Nqr domain containing protein [Pseudomonas fluorescens]|uniref:Electron transport complex subunit RnfE n=1 Tax=Pseudomonas fluorescens TaxID=294 RepID=A0A5E7CUZ6_PSEFL|nr:Rnf-Nqr domain containing protein [Pseudomonas fluorescens]VVN99323.1 Electron transport complex subunit RnfE [Pseudomonas fluorescens]
MTETSTLRNSLMLAPLIGVSDTLVKAIGLWLMFVLVITLYGMTMKAIRRWLSPNLRLAASILLATTIVSCAGPALQVWSLELHQSLGIYLGLIALQCVLLELGGFFEHSPMAERVRLSGLFGALLLALGTLREVLGTGSLGSHLAWLAGSADTYRQLWFWAQDTGPRLLTLAPGGFILLGLLIAAKQACAAFSKPH